MFNGRLVMVVLMLGGVMLIGKGASAQLLTELPEQARGIDVEDRLGEFVPQRLIFTDERGRKVALGQFFKKGKPIVMTLNYSDCPGLCVAQLDNLTRLLRELSGGGIGDDFELLTISIDPTEKPEKAARTKAKYVGMLRNTKAQEGWHFLTGDSQSIQMLADSVGFRYTYDEASKRYNHPAATYFISPDGQICRYLLSLGVEPQQFKLALGESRDGIVGPSLADAIIRFCYLYDPSANRYSANARRIMALGAGAFVLLMAGCIAPFWFTRKSKSNTQVAAQAEDASGADSQSADDADAEQANAP